MSIPYVTDGVTDLDSLLFNPIIDAVNATTNIGVGIYNVLDYGATGDGVANDTAEIQAAIDACGVAGGGSVYFPPGRYLVTLNGTDSLSSMQYRLLVKYDNVTLVGAGKRQSIIVSSDTYASGHATVAVWGPAKASPSIATATIANYDFNFNSTDLFTVYAFESTNLPVYGEYSIELDTSGDNVHFAAGDIVYIRTGATLTVVSEGQPDAEINRVRAVSGATLYLEYPLLKNYVQEYYADVTLTGPTTTSSTAFPAIFGIVPIDDACIDGFAAIDLHFECHATHPGNCVSTIGVLNPFISCTSDTTNMGLQGDGSHRGLFVTEADHTQNQTAQQGSFLSADKGCGDMTVLSSRFRNRSDDWLCFIHMNEGSANVKFENVDLINPEIPGGVDAIFSQSSRGYRQSLRNVRIQGGGSDALIKFADVDGAVVDGCDLRRDSGISLTVGSVSVSTSNVVIGDNDYGAGEVSIYHTDPDRIPPQLPSVTYQAWISFDDTVVKMGYLPANALVVRRSVKTVNNFNGAAPTVQFGKTGTPDEILGATTLGGGNLDDTFVLTVNPGFELIATVTSGGSSVGKALVFVEFVYGVTPP
jgi:hypothetical protein